MSYVSQAFVKNQLKRMKKKKATGLDGLPSQLLRDCSQTLSLPLTYLINLSIKTNQVPTLWKKARIVPIYKSGAVDTPESYRPISILPVISKILERAIHEQLMNHLEANQLLNEWQFGY